MTARIVDKFGGSTAAGSSSALRRTLGFGDLLIYSLVFMVVIAPFGIFGGVFQASGGRVALVYGVGVVAMMVTASSYGLLVQAYPSAGSVYAYAGRVIAPWVGFLAGWLILLDYILVPALLSLVAAAGAASIWPAVPVWAWIVGFVVLNTGLNLRGMKTTRFMNKLFLIGELIILAIYLLAGLLALAGGAGRGFSWGPMLASGSFHLGVVFSGVSVAALSFLGFDALSTLAEDAKGGTRQISRAMAAGLGLTGLLFIAQSWVASLLVPDPGRLLADGDPAGTAFYDTARVAAGPWLATLTAIATALAWGLANNMVAQVATSRLLYAMARDGQLPRWLGKISVKRSVPTNAILLIAAVSLTLGLWMARRADGITLMSSLVNFGALLSFVIVHVCVVVHRSRGRQLAGGWFRVWVLPPLGVLILGAVIWNANVLAQRVGFAWLGLGVLILLVMVAAGRRPRLAGMGDSDAAVNGSRTVVAGHRG
jgi:amino acid transporter